ncbi:MAG TPA: hypothetical protein VFP12_18025 [Allosphingosinicella sp.]|jgi:hypothetical protein|nr:hypothetical protein [Allosphingosinicella sp.]
MQTERVTFLTSPASKAALAKRAAAQGVSMGEYVRRRVEDENELTAEQEAELAALVAQANEAIPKMRDSMDRMLETLDKTHRETDAFLREMGVRK